MEGDNISHSTTVWMFDLKMAQLKEKFMGSFASRLCFLHISSNHLKLSKISYALFFLWLQLTTYFNGVWTLFSYSLYIFNTSLIFLWFDLCGLASEWRTMGPVVTKTIYSCNRGNSEQDHNWTKFFLFIEFLLFIFCFVSIK